MAIPSHITDGSFATAVQSGPATWSRPFEERGDTISFEYKAVFRQEAATYTPFSNTLNVFTGYETPVSITTAKGVAYLVSESETRDIGCGILEFSRTYASLPRTRYEGGTCIYTQQFYDATPEIQELVFTLNARVKYEYFLTQPSVIYSKKVFIVFDELWYYGDWVTELERGVEFLVDDTEVTIYRGMFFQRKSILAILPAT